MLVRRSHGCRATLTLDRAHPATLQSTTTANNRRISLSSGESFVEEEKKKAATSDNGSKFLVAYSVAGLNFQCRGKMNCTPNALGKMFRLVRHKSNHHPVNPTSLEHLIIPPSYLNTDIDSGSSYSSLSSTRRSFLFGTGDTIRHGLSSALQ